MPYLQVVAAVAGSCAAGTAPSRAIHRPSWEYWNGNAAGAVVEDGTVNSSRSGLYCSSRWSTRPGLFSRQPFWRARARSTSSSDAVAGRALVNTVWAPRASARRGRVAERRARSAVTLAQRPVLDGQRIWPASPSRPPLSQCRRPRKATKRSCWTRSRHRRWYEVLDFTARPSMPPHADAEDRQAVSETAWWTIPPPARRTSAPRATALAVARPAPPAGINQRQHCGIDSVTNTEPAVGAAIEPDAAPSIARRTALWRKGSPRRTSISRASRRSRSRPRLDAIVLADQRGQWPRHQPADLGRDASDRRTAVVVQAGALPSSDLCAEAEDTCARRCASRAGMRSA